MRKDIVYGLRPVIEAIEAGKEIEKVFVKKGLQGDLSRQLLTLLKEHEIPFQYVPVEKLNRISRINHQGIIALTAAITYQKLENIVPSIYEKGESPLILVMDSITDVRNFGAISRTAECAGVHALLIPSRGTASAGPDAIRTSAGALHTIPVCRTENIAEGLRFLRESGLSLVAATEKEGVVYHSADLRGPLALIMGSEDTGISSSALAICDKKVTIPVYGKIGSLNVSAAASVLIYEIVRQRG